MPRSPEPAEPPVRIAIVGFAAPVVGREPIIVAQTEAANTGFAAPEKRKTPMRHSDSSLSSSRLLIFRPMIKRLAAIAFFVTLPVIAQAQSSSVGMSFGLAEPTADGLDFNLQDSTLEIYYKVPLDEGTSLKLKYGTLESDLDIRGTKGTGDFQYLDLLVAYEFDENYGKSSMFAGIGLYRQEIGQQAESDYGFNVGVNALFPVTRRFALTTELSYHYAHFESDTGFLILSGGFDINF